MRYIALIHVVVRAFITYPVKGSQMIKPSGSVCRCKHKTERETGQDLPNDCELLRTNAANGKYIDLEVHEL